MLIKRIIMVMLALTMFFTFTNCSHIHSSSNNILSKLMPRFSKDLIEKNFFLWKAWGSATEFPYEGKDQKLIKLYYDRSNIKKGSNSIRLETTSGWDVWMEYPKNKRARWNLANYQYINFWVYTESDYSFQHKSPWIRLYSKSSDYFEYRPNYEYLDDSIGSWKNAKIPISGDNIWRVEKVGNPDISSINWIEFHVDTWNYGFKLWLDDLCFTKK